MGTGGPFPRGKARPERDADHSPPSSAEAENECKLYLLSPQAPPWRVAGSLYLTRRYQSRNMGGVSGALAPGAVLVGAQN
jgi:hypothetical protein